MLYILISVLPSAAYAQWNFFFSLNNSCKVTRPSCLAHYQAGCRSSGVYSLLISGTSSPTAIYCDQETDGGGWTLVMKIERNITPGNLEFEGTVTNNTQAFSATAAPSSGNGLNTSDLSGLRSKTLSSRNGYSVKLSNTKINALKNSTSGSVVAYRLEKVVTPESATLGKNGTYRKLFYPGSCVFKLQQFGSFGANTGCQVHAYSPTATSFSSTCPSGQACDQVSWCNQPSMASQYFCSMGQTGLLKLNDSYHSSENHNYFDHLLWVR